MQTSWTRVAVLYALGVLAAAQLGVVPPLVPTLQRDLDLSLSGAGTAVSIVTLMGAVLGFPAGRCCQSIGHGRALGIGLLIMAVAAITCALAGDAFTLLASRALAGVGYLLVVIAAPSLMATLAEPRHHAFALSLWGTFVPVGIALAGLAVAATTPTDWRAMFAVDGALLGLAMIAAFGALPTSVATPRGEGQVPLARLWRAVPLSFAFFCFALLFLALAGLLPAYLTNGRDFVAADAGQLVALATACSISGSLAGAWLLRYGIRPGILVGGGMIGSTLLAAVSFSPLVTAPLAVAGFAVSFAIGGVVPSAAFASVPGLADDRRAIGPINGLLAQTGSLGSLAGPPLLALWVGWTDWSLAPVLLLTIAVIGASAALAPSPRPASRPP